MHGSTGESRPFHNPADGVRDGSGRRHSALNWREHEALVIVDLADCELVLGQLNALRTECLDRVVRQRDARDAFGLGGLVPGALWDLTDCATSSVKPSIT